MFFCVLLIALALHDRLGVVASSGSVTITAYPVLNTTYSCAPGCALCPAYTALTANDKRVAGVVSLPMNGIAANFRVNIYILGGLSAGFCYSANCVCPPTCAVVASVRCSMLLDAC